MKRRTSRLRKVVAISLALLLATSVLAGSATAAGDTQSDDVPPFYGGGLLLLPIGGGKAFQATAGWMMADFNYAYGLTAGHFGNPGQTIYSGVYASTVWGTIQEHAGGGLDANVAPISSDFPFIWTNEQSTREVYNWETTNQDVGAHVCTSGANLGYEVCGAVDVAYGQSWNGGNYAVRANCPGTANCSIGGDSGGPVYAVFASGTHAGEVEAMGIQVAGGQYSNGIYWYEWIPIRYIMQWVWTFNRHTNLLCDICSPEP